MKKTIYISLILIFIFGLVPTNFSLAITQSQINAEVQIVCPDSYGNWFSGSGTIIDSKGIILTNKHVVTDEKGAIIKTCFIGFTESINQEPNFGTQTNPNLAEVKYYTAADDMDAAILYLENSTNKTYPYVNIWDSNSDTLQFGNKLEVIGFPSIGGSTITYTSGDFSGFGSRSDGTQNYIKTTAILEHGNSGGGAYNPLGQFIGIPTMVVTGSLNSISYLLSINSIKNWLSSVLGNDYQQEIIGQTPIIEKPTISIQNDITPPKIEMAPRDVFWYKVFDEQGNLKDGEFAGENNPFYDLYSKNDYRKIQVTMGVDGYQWSMDNMDREAGLNSVYYTYSNNLAELNNNLGDEYTIKYLPHPSYSYFPIDKWLAELTPIITLPNIKDKYYISIRFKDRAGNISDQYILTYIYGEDYIPSEESQDGKDDSSTYTIDPALIARLKGFILLQVESHGEAWYVNPADGKRYYMKDGATAYQMMRNFGLGITNANLAKLPREGENKTYPSALNNLKGKILLQVEEHGEAWYVNPKTGYRHYMKDGAAAYSLMRFYSLGVSNDDLEKIPEGSL